MLKFNMWIFKQTNFSDLKSVFWLCFGCECCRIWYRYTNAR